MSTILIVTVSLVSLVAVILAVALFVILKKQNSGPDQSQELQNRLAQLQLDIVERLGQSQSYSAEQTTKVIQLVDEKLQRTTESMSATLSELSQRVDKRLSDGTQHSLESNKQIGERLDNAARAVRDVDRKLAELSEANKRIEDVGKGLNDLQNILQAPKLRGLMGEHLLGELLGQALPDERYKMQYKFKSGELVDAAVFLEQGILTIDSKFPLENFRKMLASSSDEESTKLRKQFLNDVKKHIRDISSKYILPDEGTMDFAMMYVPAESVYYEMVLKDEGVSRDVSEFSREKHIVLVSPNTFYAYLQVIIMGLRGMKVEEHAREILNTLSQLASEFKKLSDDFGKIGTHLRHATSAHQQTEKRLDRFGNKLESSAEKTQQIPEE